LEAPGSNKVIVNEDVLAGFVIKPIADLLSTFNKGGLSGAPSNSDRRAASQIA
jgi:hypothetical protein